MAALEVLALDESTPQIVAPQSGDTYSMPRELMLMDGGTDSAVTLGFGALNHGLFNRSGGSNVAVSINGTQYYEFHSANGLQLEASRQLGWGATMGSSNDTILVRDAANTLALRNGANAQALNLYNTYADASNYERGGLQWSSNKLIIATEKAGTGSFRNIDIDSGDIISFYRRGVLVYRMTNSTFDSPAGNNLGTSSNPWGDFRSDGEIHLTGLPTSDPASAGQLWNNSGVLTVSAG